MSNISFGLPQREIINAAFFTMAMQNGLSAAIINPNSEAMMRAYYSFRALMNLDPQCSEYISVYSGQVASLGQSAVTGNGGSAAGGRLGQRDHETSDLHASIVKGLKDQAVQAAKELLEIQDAWRSSTARSFRHWM